MKTQFIADDGVVFDCEQECIEHEAFNQKGYNKFYTACLNLLDSEFAHLYRKWRDDIPDGDWREQLQLFWRHRAVFKKMSSLMEQIEPNA